MGGGPVDDELLPYLAALDGAAAFIAKPVNAYWSRVWAVRALLYAWHPGAAPAVVSALDDPAWRVREMAAKVCALREVGEAADALAARADEDEVPRVRAAAARALGTVGEGEHADVLRALLSDEDDRVRPAAERALRTLSRRLDRPL